MKRSKRISTPAHNGLYDITRQVEAIVAESKVQTGLVNVYVQGATAGIMISLVVEVLDLKEASFLIRKHLY